MNNDGLILVYTGDGKGKTTAALGLCIRSAGWGKKVCVIQFLKSEEFECGEKLFFKENNIEIFSTGIGYSWTKTPEEQKKSLYNSWEFAKTKISDCNYDLVILDEINNVLNENTIFKDILSVNDVIKVIKNRPKNQNIVFTGRNACNEIIEAADLVTEMKCIKHHYNNGVEAVKGIEY